MQLRACALQCSTCKMHACVYRINKLGLQLQCRCGPGRSFLLDHVQTGDQQSTLIFSIEKQSKQLSTIPTGYQYLYKYYIACQLLLLQRQSRFVFIGERASTSLFAELKPPQDETLQLELVASIVLPFMYPLIDLTASLSARFHSLEESSHSVCGPPSMNLYCQYLSILDSTHWLETCVFI